MFRSRQTIVRKIILSIASLLCASGFGLNATPAATALRFSLDRAIDGSAAPFILAPAKGLFRAEGLNVIIDSANGSQDAIARVASGTSEIALADINALIRYRDKEGTAPVKAVFMLYNRAPYAIIARKSRGITSFSGLEGKTVGLVDDDLAARLWPALARQNGVRLNKVKVEKISAAVREPLLSAGQVDAVSGFAFLSGINLRNQGVPANDLEILRYADFGGAVYGHALIVNPKFAIENPDAVKSFVRATIAGIRLAMKEPGRAIDAVIAQMNGASRELELERLRAVISDNIATEDVKRNGLGGIDGQRFDRAIEQIAVDFEFRKRPNVTDIFDDAFLPPVNARKLN